MVKNPDFKVIEFDHFHEEGAALIKQSHFLQSGFSIFHNPGSIFLTLSL